VKDNFIEVYYMNDRDIPVTVEVQHKTLQDEYGIYKFRMGEVTIMQPKQAKLFKVEAPYGTTPFVKTWESKVLISYVDADKVDLS